MHVVFQEALAYQRDSVGWVAEILSIKINLAFLINLKWNWISMRYFSYTVSLASLSSSLLVFDISLVTSEEAFAPLAFFASTPSVNLSVSTAT